MRMSMIGMEERASTVGKISVVIDNRSHFNEPRANDTVVCSTARKVRKRRKFGPTYEF